MMKKFALLLALALIPALAVAQSKTLSPEVRKLRDEIAALKLDRNLNLTKDQAKQLLPLLKETAALRDQLKSEQEKHQPEIVKALTAVRDDLVKTGVVSEANRMALQSARGEGTMNLIRTKMRAIHEKTRAILNPEQKARLRSFDHRPLDASNEFEGGFGDGEQPKVGAGPGRAAKLKKILKVAASPEFIGLVEARAK
ncbi:MAG TPA: hypothetical protein VGK67_10645 [Myxococcales bacterium]